MPLRSSNRTYIYYTFLYIGDLRAGPIILACHICLCYAQHTPTNTLGFSRRSYRSWSFSRPLLFHLFVIGHQTLDNTPHLPLRSSRNTLHKPTNTSATFERVRPSNRRQLEPRLMLSWRSHHAAAPKYHTSPAQQWWYRLGQKLISYTSQTVTNTIYTSHQSPRCGPLLILPPRGPTPL